MKKRFKEIRVFCGNPYVGHDHRYIEFVFENSDLQNKLMKFNMNPNIRYSRSKTGEYVYDTNVSPWDFIFALKRTDLSKDQGAVIYDEACLLAQDFSGRSGVNYYRNCKDGMSIYELIDVASEIYFDEDEKNEIARFKKDCLDVIKSQATIQESGEREQ